MARVWQSIAYRTHELELCLAIQLFVPVLLLLLSGTFTVDYFLWRKEKKSG